MHFLENERFTCSFSAGITLRWKSACISTLFSHRLDRERANAEQLRQDEEERRREQRERAEREKEKKLKEEYQRKMEEFKVKKAEEDARRKGTHVLFFLSVMSHVDVCFAEEEERRRQEEEERLARERELMAKMEEEERAEYERRRAEEEAERERLEEERRCVSTILLIHICLELNLTGYSLLTMFYTG